MGFGWSHFAFSYLCVANSLRKFAFHQCPTTSKIWHCLIWGALYVLFVSYLTSHTEVKFVLPPCMYLRPPSPPLGFGFGFGIQNSGAMRRTCIYTKVSRQADSVRGEGLTFGCNASHDLRGYIYLTPPRAGDLRWWVSVFSLLRLDYDCFIHSTCTFDYVARFTCTPCFILWENGFCIFHEHASSCLLKWTQD